MKNPLLRLMLPLVVLLGVSSITIAQLSKKGAPTGETGTLETLLVAGGTVSLELDVQRLNGRKTAPQTQRETLRFAPVSGSVLPVMVWNDELRAVQPGSLALAPQNTTTLPTALTAALHQLVLERRAFGDSHELVVRDAQSGFVFFQVKGDVATFDADTQSLRIEGARLLVSPEFAQQLGWAAGADRSIGNFAIAATLRAIEVRHVVNGAEQSAVMLPASGREFPTASQGPDVIVGDLPELEQYGSAGGQVGLGLATTSCNAGNVELNWFPLPNTDHPVIPQNLYRMSGGPNHTQRFEQIGQSWLKHGFFALQHNVCGFGCQPSPTGSRLGVGCSDPYEASLNATQNGLGSRAWVNPFTGAFPPNSREHTGHNHSATAHRLLVNVNDLNTTLNPGAAYFAEAQYVTPHEYTWCQQNPGQCNMYNNVSYRRFNVNGTTSFSFTPNGPTVRMTPALYAWTGATITRIEPAPGQDGQGFVGYKVTQGGNGVYHYEYAINNENLDRAIQSLSVPIACGVEVTEVGFHAPLNHPGSSNDGTVNSTGYSNAPWAVAQQGNALTWSSETFTQNQNANAIRWGTTYNFRFDSTQPPEMTNATIGFYKTGEPITVAVQAPARVCSPLQLASAVSRKTHGGAGSFDVPLPLTGAAAVEGRSGAASGGHTLVFTFNNEVVGGQAVMVNGDGRPAQPTFSGNTMTVQIAGVPNAQQITLGLRGVTDSFSQTLPDTNVSVKVLVGDVNSSSSVNASDIGLVKQGAGTAVTEANFRSDVTADGAINASDIGMVKSMAGATVP